MFKPLPVATYRRCSPRNAWDEVHGMCALLFPVRLLAAFSNSPRSRHCAVILFVIACLLPAFSAESAHVLLFFSLSPALRAIAAVVELLVFVGFGFAPIAYLLRCGSFMCCVFLASCLRVSLSSAICWCWVGVWENQACV